VIDIKEKELEEAKREAELRKKAQENLEQAEASILEDRKRALALGVIKEGPNKLLIFGIIGVGIAIIILLWLILKEKNK